MCCVSYMAQTATFEITLTSDFFFFGVPRASVSKRGYFSSHADKTKFHKKGRALGLILKVSVFGTRRWAMYFKFSTSAILHR